jgi:hypothetical protein
MRKMPEGRIVTLSREFMMPARGISDRADVDLDRRREFFAGDWLDGLAEHIRVGQFESFPAIVTIFAAQPIIPLVGIARGMEQAEEHFLDTFRCFVRRASLPAASFPVTFVKNHRGPLLFHYFSGPPIYLIPDFTILSVCQTETSRVTFIPYTALTRKLRGCLCFRNELD